MDSDNILSILAALGQGQGQPSAAPTNVFQQAAPAPTPPVAVQAPPPASTADIAQAATAASPPMPQPRRSLLSTIGQIADVFARVGGADPLYQATVNAREDRNLALGDHARQVDLDALKADLERQQVAAGALEPEIATRKRLGVALGALDGQADPASLWPSIAEQAGIDPQRAAAVGQILKANPASAGILAKSLGADPDNLGKNVLFGTTTEGRTVAYQVGPDGKPHILDFGNTGITPSEPVKLANTGGSTVVIGAGGTVKKVLPNTASPSTVLSTKTQKDIAAGHDRTQLTIAGMPARAPAAGSANSKASDPRAGLTIISDIQKSFDNLHKMNALPGEGGAIGNLVGSVGRTELGQAIGAKTGLSAAAQEREILAKNLANLQSDLIKSLPGNATRTRFEQEIQKRRLPDPNTMNYATANRAIGQIRQAYLIALQSQQTPVKAAPANSGWSVVGVK